MHSIWLQRTASAAASALAALVLAPAAVAAPPPNDAFASAQPLGGVPVVVSGSNLGATLEPGESAQVDGGASVWYSWTAAAAGAYRIETCGSAFDTVLSVFTGDALGSLTRVAVNDDSCDASSRVRVQAAAGVVYRIAVAGYAGDQGSFRLAISQLQPPANDDFAAAQPLSGTTSVVVSGTTRDAGREVDEPFGDAATVWYAWTAPVPGAYRFQTCGSATDAYPSLYAGSALASLESRTPYGAWVCPGGTGGWWTVVRATAGELLRIAVGADVDGSGPFMLRINPESPPANDAFAAAQPVSGVSWYVEGFAFAATSELGEPAHGGLPPGRTVWLRWTAPVSARYLLWIDGNVTLGVYTGAGLTSLTPVPMGYDPDDGWWFTSKANTEYRIAARWSEPEPYPTGGHFAISADNAGLSALPASLEFGSQTVATISPAKVVTLRPTGGLLELPLDVSVRGPDATEFLKVADSCSDEACTVAVRFAPSEAGRRSAALVIDSWLGAYSVPLTGTGTSVANQTATPTPTPVPSARPAVARASCKLIHNGSRGAAVRCTIARTPAANGTVTGTMRRGKATQATASAKLRAGKATVLLKSRRKLTPGRYSVSLSIAVRAESKLVLTKTLRVR